MDSKACTHCGEDKPLGTGFSPTKIGSGYASWCRECSRRGVANGYMLKHYGITLTDYNTILESQNGCCAICGVEEIAQREMWPTRRMPVDHDHKADKVRGILCHNCNVGLGHFRDDPKLLMAAAEYLIKGPIY